jgi:alanine-synthesizing transaminase
MGNPDLDAPRHVIEKLVETAGKPRTDRYSASKGDRLGHVGEALLGAERRHDLGVGVEGHAEAALVAFGFLMAGGVIRSVPAEPTPAFFPAAERAMQHSIPKEGGGLASSK